MKKKFIKTIDISTMTGLKRAEWYKARCDKYLVEYNSFDKVDIYKLES
jgi:hypothetical protein